MTIAIIIAGVSAAGMEQDIPKQFINVYDKPVLICTREALGRKPQYDIRSGMERTIRIIKELG